MAKKEVFSITLEPREFKDLLAVLRSLDKETSSKLRDAALPLSKRLSGQLMMFAFAAPTPQAKLVAQSIEAKRDRLIRVDVGGSKRVGRAYKSRVTGRQTSAPAGALLWGSEFGSQKGIDRSGRAYTNRFGYPYRKSGYWLNPGVDSYAPTVAREYAQTLQEVIKENKVD